jgi:hypothetical protein
MQAICDLAFKEPVSSGNTVFKEEDDASSKLILFTWLAMTSEYPCSKPIGVARKSSY